MPSKQRPSETSANKSRPRRPPWKPKNGVPWGTVLGVVALLAFIGVIAASIVPRYMDRREAQQYAPSAEAPDPSVNIPGVVRAEYAAGDHVRPEQRVAYDQAPPYGGPHDGVWATCTGTLYSKPIRTENAVHSLEHGAVWITYDPQRLSTEQISALADMVEGQSYTFMSPYPGMDSPVSVQSWGHQLKVTDPADERLAQFISALRLNENTYPEPGASCATPYFDTNNPPPFDPSPPGPDAVPVKK